MKGSNYDEGVGESYLRALDKLGGEDPKLAPIVAEYRRVIGNVEGKLVLDIGCGNGIDLPYYRSRGAKVVVGVEPSATMRAAAQKLCAKDPGIEVFPGSFISLPEFATQFDLVGARYALQYVEPYQIVAALIWVSSVLRQGGKFVFVVSHPDADRATMQKYPEDQKRNLVRKRILGGSTEVLYPFHELSDYVRKHPVGRLTLGRVVPVTIPEQKKLGYPTALVVEYQKF